MSFDSHTEQDVRTPVLEFLSNRSISTTQEITQGVKDSIALMEGDLTRARKRENECKIDQIIANALQANRTLCRDGQVERVGHGLFRITAKGRELVAEHHALIATMVQWVEDNHPGAFG